MSKENLDTLEDLRTAIVNVDINETKKLTEKALRTGVPPSDIIKMILSTGLNEVGSKYEQGEYFLSELMMSALAARAILDVVKPYIDSTNAKPLATIAIGTVEGDVHDIGKNLALMLAEGAGFRVYDLGTNVSPKVFMEKVREINPDILGLSGLLSASAPSIKETIELCRKSLDDRLKIIVGGGSVNKKVAIEYGADDYTDDAVKGVEIMKSWAKQDE